MSSPLHLLLLEDSEDEALSLVRELSRHGYALAWERVDTAEALQAALARGSWDVVICDYSQQRLRLRAAFEILQSSGQDLPFIILRGGAEDETADEVMGGAAHGYVSKDNLASLPAVIEKQLQHAAGRRCSAERDGRNNDGLFRSIFQNALAGMATVSPEGRFLQVNPALCRMLGYSEGILLEKSVLEITHAADVAFTRDLIREMRSGGQIARDYEKRYICRNGEVLWAHVATSCISHEDGTLNCLVLLVTDIPPHHQARQKAHQLAYFDSLTGLPNRQLFCEHCHGCLIQARRERTSLGVLTIDIDRFKGVNNSFGYESGDAMLKTVSQRLQDCLARQDVLARLGSDEFAVVVLHARSQDEYSVLAQKLLNSLSAPIVLDGQRVYCSVCIGIALFPLDGVEVDMLLKNAATAMHQAKQRGPKNYQFFSKGMNRMARERLEVEAGLRRSLDLGQLALHYQPKIDLKTGRVVAMEALLRWESPELGRISPLRFVPLAEETGLILPIGDWVLETACMQGAAWHRQGFSSLRMAVNISPRQFRQRDFVARLDGVLRRSGFDPGLLELELTENLVMEKSEGTLLTLIDIKARGIKLAIDDFGTGYSMLSYLKHFPIDRLKIDRSFVQDIPMYADDAAITEAILAMARSLRIKVIAEGVETREQLAFLKDRGCQEGQGYYFSRPMPADAAAEFLSGRFRCRNLLEGG
ncbi:EAL domain-containing protein [Syntrophotalea acetylenica]|uniref:putative bifunctional diguanylate cyclase/phosphodiesterase n=1 Tax=Syntrophotalea acetylenica TaxID=29542 RepID=UPI002A361DCF|nr:EAL domain-containing protein [Syntrophotalea acetylenica]MDY0260948.1 EAL domain-containing protein [Syntrophotalea acetylenica]